MRRRKAFTLIELLVTIAIIGVLATAIIVNVNNARAKSRDARRKTDMKEIATALEMYFDSNDEYPDNGTNNYIRPCSETVTTDCLSISQIPEIPADPKFKEDASGAVSTRYAYSRHKTMTSQQGGPTTYTLSDGYAIGAKLETESFTLPSGDEQNADTSSCRIGPSSTEVIDLKLTIGDDPVIVSRYVCKK